MQREIENSHWKGDLLGFQAAGATFTSLIQSIDESKVISIEAGYGRGKTFFRTAWARQLRDAGEVVVEVDAQRSDATGDPVVTFLGALIEAIPERKGDEKKAALESGKKYAGIAVRGVAKAVLKSGADEIIEELSGEAKEAAEGMKVLESAIDEAGKGMSAFASKLISAQLAADRVMQKEVPEQLDALHKALTDGKSKRVIVIIDELDRCHPEYAISLMEAMKLVFDHKGFVFCLMVNAEYLNNLAEHRFGRSAEGELYLEKFVDIRLRLPETSHAKAAAAEELAMSLPLKIQFGEHEEFSIEAAAKLAASIVEAHDISMRQIKRVLMKVELALRCHAERPLDCPLLIYLAFRDVVPDSKVLSKFLRRSNLEPSIAKDFEMSGHSREEEKQLREKAHRFISANCEELSGLPKDRYRSPELPNGRIWSDWVPIIKHLSQHYIPEHQDALNGVLAISVESQ